jgi:hypothetical protein
MLSFLPANQPGNPSPPKQEFRTKFGLLWLEAFIFSIFALPVVVILKESYPWVAGLVVFIGAVVIVTANFVVPKMGLKLGIGSFFSRKKDSSDGVTAKSVSGRGAALTRRAQVS